MRSTTATLPSASASAAIQPALAQPTVYATRAALPANGPEREIAALFDRWNAALATGEPRTVAALYAPDALLQPTVSNRVRATPAEIEDYFTHFLRARPQGVINTRFIRPLDDRTALDAGVYTFTLTKDGQAIKVQARYTFVYKKIDNEWKILQHHSSAMPEAIDTAVLASL